MTGQSRILMDSNSSNPLVHRIRHVDLLPKAIVCLRSNSSLVNSKDLTGVVDSDGLLAIAREGGSIEVVDARNKLIRLGFVPGSSVREIGDMVWLTADILIAASSSDGSVFVVDYDKQSQTHVFFPGGGAVFTLQVLHGAECSGAPLLAVGCEDGCVRIISYRADSGSEMQVECTVATTTPVLSLAWWCNCARESNLIGLMYAGCADGTIRKFECSRRDAKHQSRLYCKPSSRISLDAAGEKSASKVWSLLCVNAPNDNCEAGGDHIIVSGSAIGMVQFWDPLSSTLLCSIRQAESKLPVLCLATNRSQSKIYASGVDNRIVCISRFGAEGGLFSWSTTDTFRPHTHLVQSLAVVHARFHGFPTNETLFSGGLDTKLCASAVADWKLGSDKLTAQPLPLPKHLLTLPQQDGNHPIRIANGMLVVMHMYERRIEFYRIATPATNSSAFKNPGKPLKPNKLFDLEISTTHNLNSFAISENGRFLAISDATGTKLFQITYEYDSTYTNASVVISGTPQELSHDPHTPPDQILSRQTCSAMTFAKDNVTLICALSSGPIALYRMNMLDVKQTEDTSPFIAHLHTCQVPSCTKASMRLLISPDANFVVAGRSARGSDDVIHVFALHQDTLEHFWRVPVLGSAPHTCFNFIDKSSLVVALANNTFFVLDLPYRSLSEWSTEMGAKPTLPADLLERKDPLVYCLKDPNASNKFLLVSLHQLPYQRLPIPLNVRVMKSRLHPLQHVCHIILA